MSQVSSWDGPPTRNSMMQFMSLSATAPWAFMPRKSCKSEAESGERAGVQKITSPQSIAKLDGAISIQAKQWLAPLSLADLNSSEPEGG